MNRALNRLLTATAAVACHFALICLPVSAGDVATTKPESVGMSSERLQRIDDVMQRHIDAGDIQGGVTVVARRDKVVHFKAHGLMDVGAGTPMREDAIFRMASSTKPVAGVAILMLIEEGLVRPTDPVSRFIPEFKDLKVGIAKEGQETSRQPEVDLVPADREITVHDLLTHTSGLMSGGAASRSGIGSVSRGPGSTLATRVPEFATVPLDFQPGTRWAYSAGAGIDTLARIVEIASAQPFDEFLQERIFTPLGMNDTFFNVPEDRQDRVVTIVGRENLGQRPPTTYFSGAGGLASTAADYLRFELMLANGGELFGHRLLSPRTIEMMASNHVGDLYTGLERNENGMGFGYTVAVVLDPAAAHSARGKGAIGWGGAFGTMSWTDFKEDLVAVIMLQQRHQQTQDDFEWAIRQAIIE